MFARPSLLISLLAAGIPAFAGAQAPPVSYVQVNTGVFGFLDGEGVRLRSAENRGIKLGDFVLWPSFLLEARWDSNVFQEASDATPISAPVIRLLPGIAMTNAHPTTVGFDLGARADVRIFASSDETLQALTNAGVMADARVSFLPKGPFTITIADAFRRTLSAQSIETAATFDRNTNRAGVRFDIRPGGGALDVILGYDFVYNAFDDFTKGNYLSHDLAFRTKWRFYPKTETFIEATVTLWDWEAEPEFGAQFIDSNPMRLFLGLNGYITKKLALLVKAGYGNSFHDEGLSFNNFVGQAELAFTFSPTILAAAGFLRDYSPAFYSNFYVENRTYVRGQFWFLQHYGFEVSAGYHFIEFAEFDPIAADPNAADDGTFTVVSHKERTDHQFSAHVKFDADITRWLGVSVGYELRAVLTDFELRSTIPGESGPLDFVDASEFVRHQVYVSLNVKY